MTQIQMQKKFIARKQIHKTMVLTFMDTKCKNIFLFFVSKIDGHHVVTTPFTNCSPNLDFTNTLSLTKKQKINSKKMKPQNNRKYSQVQKDSSKQKK